MQINTLLIYYMTCLYVLDSLEVQDRQGVLQVQGNQLALVVQGELP